MRHSYAREDWSLWCQPYLPSTNSPSDKIYAQCAYLYFILKVSDLLDTVFFVLRKKHNQISFLHLYHHSMMCISSYYCVKNMVIGHLALMPIINMFVHAIMYSYYLMTCLRPQLRESAWWKKHITQIQLVSDFLQQKTKKLKSVKSLSASIFHPLCPFRATTDNAGLLVLYLRDSTLR